MKELPYNKMDEWRFRIMNAHKQKCEDDGNTDAKALGLWDDRFDFFKVGQPVYAEQFINCHVQAARDDKNDRQRLTDADVVIFAAKLCPHGDEQCACKDFASGELQQFAVALVEAIKDGEKQLPNKKKIQGKIDEALVKVGKATGLNAAALMETLAVQAKSAALLGELTLEKSKNWQKFQQLLQDVKSDCIKQLGESDFNRLLQKTKNYEMLCWFENAVGEVDDMFESCFYFKNTSYLYHFEMSNVAYKEKVLEGQMKSQAKEYKAMILDGVYTPPSAEGKVQFHWNTSSPSGSMMARANKMGLIKNGSLHLTDLYCLFAASRQVRRDYAALYRVWRTINLSIKDADAMLGAKAQEMATKEQVESLLSGLIGNDESEEQIVKQASNVIYINNSAGIVAPWKENNDKNVPGSSRESITKNSWFSGAAAEATEAAEAVPGIQMMHELGNQVFMYSRTSAEIKTIRNIKNGIKNDRDSPEHSLFNEVLFAIP